MTTSSTAVICGSTLVYSSREAAERTLLDDARAAARTRGRCRNHVLLRRLRAIRALRALLVPAHPFRIAQREMVRTRRTGPHVVVHAADALLRHLPFLQQPIIFAVGQQEHARVTLRTVTTSIPPPPAEADERSKSDRDRADERQPERQRAVGVIVVGFTGLGRQRDRLISGRGQQRIHARDNPLVELTRLEPGNDIGVENRADLAVGQHALEAVSDLDADAAIAGGPEEEQSVVPVLLADTPHREQFRGRLLDGSTVERANHDDRHLATGCRARTRRSCR